jgi:tripartite-type tricarboxylate transporter receptor subunit TctC
MKSIVTALLGAVLPLAAWSQAYPSVKPIRLIVPFAPGGNVDITARTIAPGLGEAIGQTVVVENRTGAGGVLGADAVAKSPADGYTLLMGSNSSVSVAPALNPKNPYHPIAISRRSRWSRRRRSCWSRIRRCRPTRSAS